MYNSYRYKSITRTHTIFTYTHTIHKLKGVLTGLTVPQVHLGSKNK